MFLTPLSIILTPGLKIAITRSILTSGLQKRKGGKTSYLPIHALIIKYNYSSYFNLGVPNQTFICGDGRVGI